MNIKLPSANSKISKRSDKKLFAANNYDYLLARMAEKRGDMALAMAKYQSVVNRKSTLSEYAKWHLSQIARSSGNLTLERLYLQRLSAENANSLMLQAANNRLAKSYFESKNYETAIQLLQSMPDFSATANQSSAKSNNVLFRENLLLLGHSFLQSGKISEAKEIYAKILSTLPNAAQPDDFALEAIKALDEIEVGKDVFGKAAPEISRC